MKDLVADTGVLNCTAHSSTFAACCLGREVVGRLRPQFSGRETNLHINKGAIAMLYTIAVILLIAWLLGFVGIYTIGSFVHVLLVVAIVLFLVGLLSGRRTLA